MVRFRHIALGGIALVGAGILTLCGGFDAFAADNISLSIDTTNISLDIVPRTAEGEFVESSNTNISVSTTSTSGYTLSIASSTGSTDLTNTTDNTSTITSISTNLTNSDFSNSSNTQYNNKWGYKPSQYVTIDGDTHTTTDNTGSNAVFKPLPGTSGEIIAITDQANQPNTPDSYTISMGARANNETKIGSYQSDPFIIMAVANKSVVECDDTKLCVKFDGNGLVFPETNAQLERTVNSINYDSSSTQQSITKYSHTPNISDDGTYSGSTYTSNMDTTDTVTINGATSLNVTIYYDTESASYDWVSVYQSPFDISNTNDATVSNTTGNLSGKLAGRNTNRTTDYTTWYTQTYTVTGDTVKFHFRSDNIGNYYGYYAVITGTGIIRNRTLTSGEYATPTGAIFYGWSSTQTTPGVGLPSQVEYADEAAVKSNMPGDNTEAKTLYAVWQQDYPITFTMDNNTSSIAVLDANGATVGTITSSGQSLTLLQGDTYTLKPTYVTGYTTDVISKTSGAGVISGDVRQRRFTVGAGSATISVTSKPLSPIQNFNCSALANIGDTEEIYDTRDNEVYLIGKLADNKCWLLDNLRLDLVASKNNLSSSNTNATDTQLNYLKNGGGTTSDQWPTSGVSYWTSTSRSYSDPWIAIKNANDDSWNPDTTTTSYGDGSGKIGIYYNYCAASAGTYCWGNGTDYSGSPSSDPKTSSLYDIDGDICPKGWHLPTTTSGGEYENLYNAYSSAPEGQVAAFLSALSMPLSGYFYNGSALDQSSDGRFWSSTWYNTYGMRYLYVSSSNVVPSYNDNRYYGNSVRCVQGSA